MSIAYALRATDADSFGGGVLSINGEALDIEAALKAGNGRIEVDETDHPRITALDSYPPLERVQVKASKSTTPKKKGA